VAKGFVEDVRTRLAGSVAAASVNTRVMQIL
jgi:hypothetical protein